MNLESYRYERLTSSNLNQLVGLYKACFGINTNISFLRKKYDTIRFGAEYIGYFAKHNQTNEVAGYYGVFPILASYETKSLLIAQSGDTMTHPKHQGKGLFTVLAKLTYELAINSGIEFVFGFPNKNSYPGFIKKLNWKHLTDINNYSIKGSLIPCDKLAKKIPLFEQAYKLFIKTTLKKYTINKTFENSLSKQNTKYGFIIHDEKFYNYKTYFGFYILEIEKIKCIVKIDGRFWIGDIEHCHENSFFSVVDRLILIAKKLGCSSVQFSLFNDSPFDILIKKKYKEISKNPIGHLNLSNNFSPNLFAYQAVDFDTY